MQVILMERVAKLGQMGEVVKVRDGYARNYLLPQGKAFRATKSNMERFETERVHLEAHNLERRGEAESVAAKMDGVSMIIVRQAAETGQLYGSVSPRDIAEDLTEIGFAVNRSQINLNNPIKTIGLHEVEVNLHPEVQVSVGLNVARSEDEAKRQARGEDLSRRNDRFQYEEDLAEDEGAEDALKADDAGDAGESSDEAGSEAEAASDPEEHA